MDVRFAGGVCSQLKKRRKLYNHHKIRLSIGFLNRNLIPADAPEHQV